MTTQTLTTQTLVGTYLAYDPTARWWAEAEMNAAIRVHTVLQAEAERLYAAGYAETSHPQTAEYTAFCNLLRSAHSAVYETMNRLIDSGAATLERED